MSTRGASRTKEGDMEIRTATDDFVNSKTGLWNGSPGVEDCFFACEYLKVHLLIFQYKYVFIYVCPNNFTCL